MRYRCPACGQSDELWREVEVSAYGYEDVDDELNPTGTPDIDVWDDSLPSGQYGCRACSWNGPKNALVRLGIDGEPLRPVSPDQLSLVAA